MLRLMRIVPLISLALATAATAAVFYPLGDLPGGDFYSQARGVSGDGTTVVGSSSSANSSREAFYWTAAGGTQPMGDLAGGEFYSEAYAASHDGSVIVGYGHSAAGAEAFRWTTPGGLAGLGDLPGGEFSSLASGVSADGSMIVGIGNYSAGGGPHPVTGQAVRWLGAGPPAGLGDVPGGTGVSRAYGVSSDGSVIVGKGNAGSSFQAEDLGVAMRWTAATGMVSLGFLPGGSDLSIATGVSADGATIVGFSRTAAGAEAFRWTATDQMVGLGTLAPAGSPQYSAANGVSADGALIVGQSATPAGDVAFLWDSTHGMRNLQQVLAGEHGLSLPGWTLAAATGISEGGTVIVGNGTNPAGQTEAWAVVVLAAPTWTGNGGPGNARWDVPANWFDNSVPANSDVTFGASFNNGNTIDLNGNRSAQLLTFTNTGGNDLTFVNGALNLTGIRKQ